MTFRQHGGVAYWPSKDYPPVKLSSQNLRTKLDLSQSASVVNEYFGRANAQLSAIQESSNPLDRITSTQPDIAVVAEPHLSRFMMHQWAVQVYFFSHSAGTDIRLVVLGDEFMRRATAGTGSTLSLKKGQEQATHLVEYLRYYDPQLELL